MQGGTKPTRAQQSWQDWLRAQGCCNCEASNTAIHHCVGSTAKHNKVHIGQWWTIPLCYECHQGPEGMHNSLDAFRHAWPYQARKEIEKSLFLYSVEKYITQHPPSLGHSPLMSEEVIDAIMDYHK